MPSLNLDEIVLAISEVELDENTKDKVIEVISNALNNKKREKDEDGKDKKHKKTWAILEADGSNFIVQYGLGPDGNPITGDPSELIDTIMTDYNVNKGGKSSAMLLRSEALKKIPAKYFKNYGIFIKSKNSVETYSI